MVYTYSKTRSLGFFFLLWFSSSIIYAQSPFRYEVGLTQNVDVFSDVFDPQVQTSVFASAIRDHGKYTLRINEARRFDQWGTQVELEAYPKFGGSMYGYVAYAFSPSEIFPDHRFGAEFFSGLPMKSEGSIGLRYLHFPQGGASTLLTGSLSHYWKSYLFSVRPFLIFAGGGQGQTVILSARKFFNDAGDFIALRGGGGASPEGILFQLGDGLVGSNLLLLATRQIGIEAKFNITSRIKLFGSFDLIWQELAFNPGQMIRNHSSLAGVAFSF